MSHPSSGHAPKSSLGIDLGTTHTVVAHRAEVLRVSREPGRETLLPSVVAYPPTGETLVGWPARNRRAIDPRHTLASTKRLIGAAWESYRAKRFAERHPYELIEREGAAALRTRQGVVSPSQVAAAVLGEACGVAECEPSTHAAVISVPAGFEADERAATLDAARKVGFPQARLIEEPVATAVAYLERSNLRYAVIYDLGGGTFDLAVVDCTRHPFRVVGHGGDPYLGGDDVDRIFATRVAERILRSERWDVASDPETFARLTVHAEAAKVALGDTAAVQVALDEIDEAAPSAAPVTFQRADLVGITTDIVRRTFVVCDHVLSDAGLRTRDIDAVFLAGGSTSLPGLREMVGEYFGKRARFDLDPMHVVARGASLAALRPDLHRLLEADGYAA
ncbi:MAG: Hsp70 family protein [Myxococcota bacterium]|nr:Hsp70 family protein [Myxococcota bacterium]